MRHMRCAALALIAGVLAPGFSSAAHAETLTLEQCVRRALERAPAVDAASAGLESSQADLQETRAPLRPTLRGALQYEQDPGYNTRITERGRSSGQLLADYVAFDGGRRLAQVRAARYAAEAAALGVGAARAQITLDTEFAYFELLRARQAEDELASSFERLAHYRAMVAFLVQTGHAIPSDSLKLEVARDQAELARGSAHQTRRRASLMLGSFIGAFDQDDIAIAKPPAPSPPSTRDFSPNPLLQTGKREVAAAGSEVEAARAERYPTLTLGVTSGFLGIDPQRAITHNGGVSYDGMISVPLFDGGVIRSHIERAKALQDQARARLRQTELDLTRRLGDADSRYREARQALTVLERALPAAEDAFALGWARFLGGGNITLLEVLDAYTQAAQLRLQRVDQEQAARQAAAEMAQLVGLDQ